MKFSVIAASAIILGSLSVSAAPASKRGDNSKATWYSQGGNAGSCGKYHSDDDHVVALPSGNGCGRKVVIEHNGKQTHATVADTCPSCDSNQIDLSKGAFRALADMSEGEIPINWWFE